MTRVRLTDVAPRDGLQNEPALVPVDQKAALVEHIARAGVDEVEVTSFVSTRWVPQLGDAEELAAHLAPSKPAGIVYSALVPNERGLDRLLATNNAARERDHAERLFDRVSVFTAASETFSQKNTNASIEATLERFVPVLARARQEGLGTRAYVSCVIACPFEGAIAPTAVARVAARLLELGADEVDLGDTIGAATPETLGVLLSCLSTELGSLDHASLHLHDTTGAAPACVRVGLEHGVRAFDASSGGLGGCPYASTPERRAPGNIAMTTLVRTIRDAGFTPGVGGDISDASLADAAAFADQLRHGRPAPRTTEPRP